MRANINILRDGRAGTAQLVVLLLSVATLLVNLVQVSHGHEEHMELANKQVTLRDVCSNRQVPIISVDEARRLIADLKRDPSVCPQHYVQSFFELEPILVLEPTDRLCSEHKFDQIKDFHFRYINPLVESYELGDDLNALGKKIARDRRKLDEAKVDYTVQLDDYKQEILIPISLQQFFKAWALQVSGMCKRTLVDNLERALQQLTDEDLDIIDQVTAANNNNNNNSNNNKQGDDKPTDPLTKKPIAAGLLSQELGFNELVYLPRLEGELEPGDAELRDQVTILDLRSQPELNRLMQACKRRFKPVYSKLIMPIVRLSKLGYEYVGPKLDSISDKLTRGKEIRRWMALTKICEAHGNYELIESSTTAGGGGGGDGDGEAQVDGRDGNKPINAMEMLDYEPVYNYRVDGELWVKGAEVLAKELDRINGHNSRGLQKFLFNAGVAGRKLVAALDPHQFAWYRRNQNTLASGLNVASIISNTVSMVAG